MGIHKKIRRLVLIFIQCFYILSFKSSLHVFTGVSSHYGATSCLQKLIASATWKQYRTDVLFHLKIETPN